MNNDFEVHRIGTTEELKLSRALATEIQHSLEDNEVVPINVRQAYNRLYGHYIKQQQSEKY